MTVEYILRKCEGIIDGFFIRELGKTYQAEDLKQEAVLNIIKSRGGQLFLSSNYEGRRWAHFMCPNIHMDFEIEERP